MVISILLYVIYFCNNFSASIVSHFEAIVSVGVAVIKAAEVNNISDLISTSIAQQSDITTLHDNIIDIGCGGRATEQAATLIITRI